MVARRRHEVKQYTGLAVRRTGPPVLALRPPRTTETPNGVNALRVGTGPVSERLSYHLPLLKDSATNVVGKAKPMVAQETGAPGSLRTFQAQAKAYSELNV